MMMMNLSVRKGIAMETTKRRGRGLASMSPEARSRIASLGGKKAHALGTAHKWTAEEAQAAGRIGGSRGHAGKGPRKPKEASDV